MGGNAGARPRRAGPRLRPGLVLALAFPLVASPGAPRAAVPAPGDLLVADRTTSGGAILLVKRPTGAVSTLSAGNMLVDPRRLVVGLDGTIFVVDAGSQGGGSVVRIDPRDGSQTVIVATGLVSPTGITLAWGGFAFLTHLVAGMPHVVRVNLLDGKLTPFGSASIPVTPVDVVLEPTGMLVVADSGIGTSGDVLRVDPIAQQVTQLNAGVSRPSAVGLEADGNILIAGGATAASSGIYRVGPGGGPATPVSLGLELTAPKGIAVAPFGTIFVADQGTSGGAGAIIAVDPKTGVQTTVASGSPLGGPNGIAVVTKGVPGCGNGILDPEEQCDQGGGNGGTSACCGVDCRLVVADVACPAEASFCATRPDGTACTSDDACVTGATCQGGTCTGGAATCDAEVQQGARQERRRASITVDCRVDGDPRQPCVAQGFLAAGEAGDTTGRALPSDCSAPGAPVTRAVERVTNRQNRRRFDVPLKACAKRRLRKAGSLDVNMIMRMGDGDDRRDVLRRLRLQKPGRAGAVSGS